MAFTKVSLPAWVCWPPTVVVRYSGNVAVVVLPFDPAGRMFSSAPPGNRASSGVVPPLMVVVVVGVPLVTAAELSRSLCSWAPVTCWICWCGCWWWCWWV